MPVRNSSVRPPDQVSRAEAERMHNIDSSVAPLRAKGTGALDARALQRTIGNRATSILLSAQRSRPDAQRLLQRAVPTQLGLPKPQPATGSYQARGGNGTPYDAEKHPRSKFNFGSNTRDEVLSRAEFHPQRVGNRIISVVDRGSGQQVNVEGIQLDHSRSWDAISNTMMAHNRALQEQGRPFDANSYYTLWDAKMYYNDQPNLFPALGGLNASAGAAGVVSTGQVNAHLEVYVGQVHAAFMNLQQGLASVDPRLARGAVEELEEIAIRLADVRDRINAITDKLF